MTVPNFNFSNPAARGIPSFGSMQFGGGIPSLTGVGDYTTPVFNPAAGQTPTPQFGFMPNGVGGPSSGFGFNLPTAQLGLSGLASLGNLWGAFQAQSLARDQLDFTKQAYDTNLKNSLTSYNTALEDRARARGATEGQSQEQVQSYIDKNRLTR